MGGNFKSPFRSLLSWRNWRELLGERRRFLPTDLPNLALWLIADTGTYQDVAKTVPAVLDTDPVGAWEDQSGNGNDALQNVANQRPLLRLAIVNGKPVLRFDGGNDELVTGAFLDASFNTALTFYIVSAVDALAGGIDVSTSHNGLVWFSAINTAPQQDTFNTSGLTDTQFVSNRVDTDFVITGFIYDGSDKYIRQDGAETSEAALGNLGLNGALTIGNLSTGGFPFLGDIAEIIIYNRVLTVAERVRIEQYLG